MGTRGRNNPPKFLIGAKTMRVPLGWGRWLGLVLIGLPSLAPADEPGFRPLFDGKSLDGWQRIGARAKPGEKDRAFGVEGDRIVSYGEGGGWLGTERDYGDFVLRLEFRLTPDSNSGIYLRAPADTSHISRTGLEIQVLDEDAPRHKDIQPWQKTGAIYHVAAPKLGYLKPPGEWNRLEIRAEGPHVVIKLNGATVVDDRLDHHPDLEAEHPGLKRRQGRIGLQSHNGRVDFRNIQIETLGTSETSSQ